MIIFDLFKHVQSSIRYYYCFFTYLFSKSRVVIGKSSNCPLNSCITNPHANYRNNKKRDFIDSIFIIIILKYNILYHDNGKG